MAPFVAINYFFYLFIITFSLQIKLLTGVYFSTLLILCFGIYSLLKKNSIQLKEVLYLFLLFLCVFFSIFLQQLNLNEEVLLDFELKDLLVPYKLLVLFLCTKMFSELFDTFDENYHLVVLFLAVPILLSLLLFLFREVEPFIYSLYKQERYEGIGRFGGIYGKDVNTFGMYASLFFLYVSYLKINNKLNPFFSILFIALAVFCILISGMRTGLLVGFPAICYFIYLKYSFNKMLFVISLSVFSSILFLNILFYFDVINNVFYESILGRFSLDNLAQSLRTDDGGGNLNHAIRWLDELLDNRSLTISVLLAGYDVGINFVDNLYFYLFIKHGLFMVLLVLILFLYCFYYGVKKSSIFLLLAIFAFVVSFKGIFVLNEYFLLFLILIYRASNEKNYN